MSAPILVVDDDLDIRESVADVFEAAGYETMTAANGQEALELLESGGPQPAFVLLDLMMPVMDGWQFHERLRDRPAMAAVPVVVFTADGKARGKAATMGAAHLDKPASVDALLALAARYIY